MSMNATFVGRQGKKVYEFKTYQTPTTISYKMRDAKDPVQVYKDWIYSWLGEVAEANDHCNELDLWAKGIKELGLRVEVNIS